MRKDRVPSEATTRVVPRGTSVMILVKCCAEWTNSAISEARGADRKREERTTSEMLEREQERVRLQAFVRLRAIRLPTPCRATQPPI